MTGYIVPILVLILGGLGFIVRQELEKRRKVEEQLSVEKYQTYMIFVDAMFGVFHELALSREKVKPAHKKQDELVIKLQEFSKKVIFYGSDDVIREFQAFTMYSQEHPDAPNVAASSEAMAKVIVAIRKDMGQPDTKFTPKTFIKQLTNDYHIQRLPGGAFHEFDKKYNDI